MTLMRPAILAIDDNPQNLVMLATALEAEFDFELASSGEEGIRLAQQHPPALILLDVMMPEVDGFEICRRIKRLPELASIPIIFLTALTDLGTEVQGLELGAVDYISKPINVALVKQRIRNILKLTQLTRDLQQSEERLRLVMEATGEGIWDWDIAKGDVTHNSAWCRILGLDDAYLSHRIETFTSLIHPEDAPAVQEAIHTCLHCEAGYISEHRLRTTDGKYIWVTDRGQVVQRSPEGTALRMVGSIRNIDDRKRYEAEIQKLAFYDTLTELPNRRLLIDRLHKAIQRNQRRGEMGAVMFLDMDRFKHLNDTHGHAIGDALLTQVASRLRHCVRAQDTVARLGGDEFVVLLDSLSTTRDGAQVNAHAVADKILQALNEPYRLSADLSYSSTPSIGVTVFGGTNDSVDSILCRADEAMYKAKCAGRNNIKMSA